MAKRPDPRQPSLFAEEPPTVAVSAPLGGLSYRDALREQIIRDIQVLRGDPIYYAPSRDFFEERIAAYRAELDALGDPA